MCILPQLKKKKEKTEIRAQADTVYSSHHKHWESQLPASAWSVEFSPDLSDSLAQASGSPGTSTTEKNVNTCHRFSEWTAKLSAPPRCHSCPDSPLQGLTGSSAASSSLEASTQPLPERGQNGSRNNKIPLAPFFTTKQLLFKVGTVQLDYRERNPSALRQHAWLLTKATSWPLSHLRPLPALSVHGPLPSKPFQWGNTPTP